MLADQPADGLTARRAALLPFAAAMVTVLLWASAFVAIRHVGRDISGGPLSFGRLLVASLLLGAFLFVRRNRPRRILPPKSAWTKLLLCGILWFGVYNVALNEGERRIDAGTASMLVNIGPIVIAILAGFLLHEGFPRQLVMGGSIAFAGVVVIGVATSSGSPSNTWGVVLCVVAALSYGISVVAQKPLLAQMSALHVTWMACTIGLIACLPFAPALVREVAASPSSIWWVVYLGALPTAVAFTTWAYALARTSAGKLGVTTYLVPPLTILLGWLLLSETPILFAFGGGALCLIGVYVTRRRPAGGAA